MKCRILLFVKYPSPGKVKTRLATEIGAESAAEVYRVLMSRVADALPREVPLTVVFDPPDEMARVQEWLQPLLNEAEVSFMPQAAGGLTERLQAAFARSFEQGDSHVCAIGSDCIHVSTEILAETWENLETHDMVVGPATDGGYYLIALKEPQPLLFAGIPWSTADVLPSTLEKAATLGLTVHLLPQHSDVDTSADWDAARRQIAM